VSRHRRKHARTCAEKRRATRVGAGAGQAEQAQASRAGERTQAGRAGERKQAEQASPAGELRRRWEAQAQANRAAEPSRQAARRMPYRCGGGCCLSRAVHVQGGGEECAHVHRDAAGERPGVALRASRRGVATTRAGRGHVVALRRCACERLLLCTALRGARRQGRACLCRARREGASRAAACVRGSPYPSASASCAAHMRRASDAPDPCGHPLAAAARPCATGLVPGCSTTLSHQAPWLEEGGVCVGVGVGGPNGRQHTHTNTPRTQERCVANATPVRPCAYMWIGACAWRGF